MKKQLKTLLIVIPICFSLTGLTVLLYLLDPDFTTSVYIISSMTISCLWAFFMTPALLFAIPLAKSYCEGLDFRRGYRLGYLLGRGWGALLVLLLLLASPVVGTLWFVQTIKSLIASRKSKRDAAPSEDDVFDLEE